MDLAARTTSKEAVITAVTDYNNLRASVGLKKVSSFSEISSNKDGSRAKPCNKSYSIGRTSR